MRMPIPEDWDGESWGNWVICWPDSPEWKLVFLNFLTAATRGRFWDGSTGSIVDAQKVGGQILKKNESDGGVMACNDLVTVLESIATAIQNIEASQTNIEISTAAQAEATSDVRVSVLAVAQSLALASAHAESIATATASVTLQNEVNIQIGSVSPTQPPLIEQEPETGISPTPINDDLCDVAVYIVDATIAQITALQKASVGIGKMTVTAAFGLVAEAIWAAAIIFGPLAAPIIAPAGIASIAGKVVQLATGGVLDSTTDALTTALGLARTDLICLLYNEASQSSETALIRSLAVDQLELFGELSQEALELFFGFLSPPMLALLYYQSSLVQIPTQTDFDCQSDCGVGG